MTVALFVTCLTDTFYPSAGVSLVRVLRRLGDEVTFPAAQTCCGQPLYNNGFPQETEMVLRHFVEVFEPFECIVTPSGSCAAFLREHAVELFQSDADLQRRLRAVVGRVYEFAEFLLRVRRTDFAALHLRFPHRVTYHYSCHLRGLKMGPDCLNPILTALQGCDFVPLSTPEQCCGFGGTFADKFSSLSTAITESKLDDIARTGAEVCICNDAGCGMNLGGLLNREWKRRYPDRPQPRLMHLAQVLDEAGAK